VTASDYPGRAHDAAPTIWDAEGDATIIGGFGSALVADPHDASMFWVLTDRGPNTTTAVADQLLFPIPDFTPTVAKLQLVGHTLRTVLTIPLRSADGRLLSGRPNPVGEGATGESGIDTLGAQLTTDAEGLDSEGLAVARDGTFWVSDEYGPHIVHFDATGRTIERINPYGTGTGGRRLPRVLALRRPNRGMEGLAITPDDATLVGAMQSPLDNPTPDIGRLSNANRLIAFDIASGATRTFVYECDAVGNFVNEITALTATTFIVIERDAEFQRGTPAAVTKRIYRIDLSAATDISDPDDSAHGATFGGRVLEALTPAERVSVGIVPVSKTLVYDLLTLPGGYPHDKPEGATLVGSDLLVVSNDDDFGVADGGNGSFVAKLLPRTQLRDRWGLYFIKLPAPLR
jgi:hypothetical protein